jgi:hypothetical protein
MSERRTISKRDVANLTGGVETADGRVLYGLDAETYLKVIIFQERVFHLKNKEQLHFIVAEVCFSGLDES